MSETTTIQISKETRDALKEIGSMGDDYNKVIQKLIAEYRINIARQNIDKTVEEGERLYKEHPEEFVSIDDL
jgi:hypothetical protein